MGNKHFRDLVRGPGFSLGTWVCTHSHTQPGREQYTEQPTINVVLDGGFVRHIGRRSMLVDPTVAVVLGSGGYWRTSHLPGCCGDRGIWVMLDPDLHPRDSEQVRPLSGARWFQWHTVARTGDVELATALVADIIDGSTLPAREPWYVSKARRHLAEQLQSPPDLTTLAADIGVSPWHLCRTFRASTGCTPRAYSERLRLTAAACAIAAGRPDLSELAYRLGFSSHSHLTARYRALFGATPRSTSLLD